MRLFYIAFFAAVALAGAFWWWSLQPPDGVISMGEESRFSEIVSLVIAVCGALAAAFNMLQAYFKMREGTQKK
ncbi:MAG: hypothetical protein AAGC86_13510 [Pseudomonadota bacterium]